jgi:phage-related protein
MFGTIGSAISGVAPVLLAVGVAIAALKYIWDKDIGGIREVTQRFTDWCKGIFSKTFDKVHKDVTKGLSELTKGFGGWSKNVMGPINQGMHGIVTGITGAMKKIIQSIANGVTTVTSWFAKMAPDFNKAIKQIVRFLEWLSPLWKALWTVLKFVVGQVWDWIVGIIKHGWGVFSGIIQLFTHIINGQWKKAFGDLWQIIKNAFLLALDLFGGVELKFAGFFTKILAHTGIFGKVFKAILGPVFKFLETTAKYTWKMAEGIFKGGVQIVSGVIHGLEKGLKLVWKAISTLFHDHASGAMSVLTKLWKAGFGLVKTLAHDWWHGVVDIWKAISALFHGEPGKAMKYLMDAFKNGFKFVRDLLKGYSEAVGIVFKHVGQLISKLVGAAVKWLKDAWKEAITSIGSRLSKWEHALSTTFNSIKTKITSAIKTALTFMKNVFHTELQGIKVLLNTFKSVATSIFNGIKSLITGHSDQAMKFFKQAFKIGVETVHTILKGLLKIADSALGGLPSKFLSWGRKAISSIVSAFSSTGSIRSKVLSIISAVDGALGNLPSKMLGWGKNAIGMFASGIESGIKKIESAVKGVANKVKGFLGFHSPTKEGPLSDSDVYFPNMMKMFTDGIDKNKDKVMKATMGVAVGVQQSITGTQKNVHQFVGNANQTAAHAIHTHNMGNNRQQVININIDGRSAKTDQQLAENIAKQFRTQMSMVFS